MDNINSLQKNVFVVLGMSRSGTSAIARSLAAMGVDLGNRLLEGDSRNPKGFYEDSDILYKINRGVSAAIDYHWIDFGDNEKQIENNPALRDYKNYAVGLLCERFINSLNWGFKDPRTVTILPFWQSVFKALNVNEHYILAVRNPLASAVSNQKFAKTDMEAGLLLWIKILKQMIDGTENKKRVLISYEMMLQNPHHQLERVQHAFNLTATHEQITNYTNEFLDKKLQHHVYTDEDLKTHPAMAIAPIAMKMYELVMRVARDEIQLDSDEFKTAWVAIKNEFSDISPTHAYIEQLARRNKQLERQLRTIRKSFPYKLIYPLRMIDDLLRLYRRKSKRLMKLTESYEQ
ncbi:MAG: glycosyl transferase, family 2 [uncultured bacterium]|nr:MAG: glycosyl transferase, family 2 [uncultured bacterium]